MFVNIPSAKLKQMVRLSERKEALLAQIQEIEREMLRLERQFGETRSEGVRKARLKFSIVPPAKTSGRRSQRHQKKSVSRAAPKG